MTFVSFQIIRDRPARTLYIYQEAYTIKLLDQFKLSKSNPMLLLILANTVMKLDANIPPTSEYQQLQPDKVTAYCQAVSCLLYLSNCTQLDLYYTVSQLARHIQDLRVYHLRIIKQVLRYLNGTRKFGIWY
jgi:hypothetical protein